MGPGRFGPGGFGPGAQDNGGAGGAGGFAPGPGGDGDTVGPGGRRGPVLDGAPPVAGTRPGPFDGDRTAPDGGRFPGPGPGPRAGGLGGLLDAAAPSEELIAAIQTDADQYTWGTAMVGSNQAAGVQLATGVPVMPIGGFNGSDPSPSLEQFQRYVSNRQIHYFLGGGPRRFGRANGGSDSANQIAAWVVENFSATTIGGVAVYDLTG